MPKNEVELNSFNPHVVIEKLAYFFRTQVLDNHAELKIEIPSSFGEGHISGIDFKDGLGILLFDCQFKKDLILKYISSKYQPLRMIFCMENDLTHIIKADRIHYQLNHLLGSMVSGSCKNEQLFWLPAEKRIFYYSIEIDRKKYRPKINRALQSLPHELKEIFCDVECKGHFLYQGHYSLTIAECIQNINQSEHKGLVRRVFLESKTLEIFALKVKQYLDDREPTIKQSVLRKKDIELVISAHKILMDHLKTPPTISELARLVGTNEGKLKKGFKRLYNASIYNVIQDERLNKAKILIAENRYSVKEIAKLVGYNHAGHFTSKFKKKFGMLPKDYLKSIPQ
jgi:AraC family transcriptional regulator, transcriptional activator of the genes for pyochelin and ferripyochelin receptors